MKLWLLDYHPSFANFEFERMEDFERLSFDGQPLMENWSPPSLTGKNKDKPTDFLKRHNGALLITEKAKALFQQHLHPGEVEFLPVPHDGETYYFAHVLNLVACIDVDGSKEERTSSGMLRGYEQYAFHKHLVEPHRMLRVRYHEGDRLVPYPFVGEELHAAITNSDLCGYQIIEMWNSEYSWQQQEIDYQAMVDNVTRSLTKTFDYSTASLYIEKKGMIVYSGHWAMRHDAVHGLVIGKLLADGTYDWAEDLIYIPPILFSLTWGIRDPEPEQQGLLGKLGNLFSAGRKRS